MRAMILAAGLGTRLRPLTLTVPKPLIEVAGRPMIHYALDLVVAAGIREVVINLHHLGHQIRAALGDGSTWGIEIHYSEEPTLLDTGGGIAAAKPWLSGEPFVVVNADVYLEGNLRELMDFHQQARAIATLWVRPDPSGERHDDVRVDPSGRVHALLGQGRDLSYARRLPRYFYASVMVCSPEIFRFLPPGVYSLTRHVLPQLLLAGEPVFACEHRGYWRVLDTPGDLEAGRREIAERRRKLSVS
jgi:NDP-sugar pyrophosphorylase family protein